MTFWVVWNPGHGSPRVRHESQTVAEREAHRLAIENPGVEFYVLAAVKEFKARDPVEVRVLDEIPF